MSVPFLLFCVVGMVADSLSTELPNASLCGVSSRRVGAFFASANPSSSLSAHCLLNDTVWWKHQDPLVQQYNSRVRRSCYTLDDIPKCADLGPYWYEGVLPRGVRFFFRKRFHAVSWFSTLLCCCCRLRLASSRKFQGGTCGGASQEDERYWEIEWKGLPW